MVSKTKRALYILWLLICICFSIAYTEVPLLAAEGTATLTVEWLAVPYRYPSAVELKWIVTSDGASGDCTAPTVTTTTVTDSTLGWIWEKARRIDRVAIVPASGGTQPDDLFDVELRVNSSVTSDLLGGLGDNLSNAATTMDAPDTETNALPVILRETPIIYAVNMGTANTFTLYLLLTAIEHGR